MGKIDEVSNSVSRLVGVASLSGYQLIFPRFLESREGGVASIEKKENATIWGVVYEIDEICEKELDRKEDVHLGRYRKEFVEVEVRDSGQPLKCLTYISRVDGVFQPSEKYLNIILQGAREHGFPEEYIENIKNIKAIRRPA